MLKDDFDCVFYTSEPNQFQIDELNKVCRYVSLTEKTKHDDFLGFLNGSDLVVLDNYFFTTDYQIKIKSKGCRLVCIDDMHDKHYVANAVINYGTTDSTLFSTESTTKLCLGFDWMLLRRPFRTSYQQKKRNDTIVLCFGGADPHGVAEKMLWLLSDLNITSPIVAINNNSFEIPPKLINSCEVKYGLSATQMAHLFATSALGIMAASTVFLEGLSQGLPMIVGFHVDNQLELYQSIKQKQYGITVGNLQELTTADLQHAILKAKEFQINPINSQETRNNYIHLFQTLI